jgi:hypothetical protein
LPRPDALAGERGGGRSIPPTRVHACTRSTQASGCAVLSPPSTVQRCNGSAGRPDLLDQVRKPPRGKITMCACSVPALAGGCRRRAHSRPGAPRQMRGRDRCLQATVGERSAHHNPPDDPPTSRRLCASPIPSQWMAASMWASCVGRGTGGSVPSAPCLETPDAVTARSGVCDEAVSALAQQEIASLVAVRWAALWADPLAMTAKEFLAAQHASERTGVSQ